VDEESLTMHDISWGDSPDAPDHNSSTACSMRWSLVLRIRRQVERGGYDTPEKLDTALNLMYDQVIPKTLPRPW
jgi:hypothetical protein